MPWINVWLHFVWSTKGRFPFLQTEIRNRVFDHMRENAREKKIYIDFINGYLEHVHCLISLGANQTIEQLMQLIKGESSFWINKNKIIKRRFEWADEYFASSVSEDKLDIARAYILNQQEHHKKVTFKDEYEKFLTHFGFHRG